MDLNIFLYYETNRKTKQREINRQFLFLHTQYYTDLRNLV